MQGCPLHCPWCANPESQQINTHLMYNSKKCVKCRTCVKNCPQKAITVENGQLNFDRKKCITCKTCKENCPADAVDFIERENLLKRLWNLYLGIELLSEESGGGVTISGGEPFVQFDFLINVLKKCKEYNINTAIETTGDTSWSNIEMVLPYVDLFLYDMKHSVPEKIIENYWWKWI
ncbi:MAG: glycyl-radical enzyme activating protein [Anaerobutyricum soehngenii]